MSGKLILFAFIAFLVVEEGLSTDCSTGFVKNKLRCNTRNEWTITSDPINPGTNIDWVIRAKEGQECKGVWRPTIVGDKGEVVLEISLPSHQVFEARLICFYHRGARKITTRFEIPNAAAPAEEEREAKEKFCLKGLRQMTTKVSIKFFESSPGSLEIYKFRMNACVPQ